MKKILVILIIATLFLSGCNATGSESTPVTQTIENPSSTLVVLSNSINELEIDNILNCFDLAQPDKDMVTSKFEELEKNTLFKVLFKTAVSTSVKEIISEEIDGEIAKVNAIVSIETIKNLGDTAINLVEKIIKEGASFDESQIQSLLLGEISKIDVTKKEIIDVEMKFNMVLVDETWIISTDKWMSINNDSINIYEKK
ncbi:MAG: hypothetical protein GX675_05805 [Erysipelotrichaceae bacterium]|nr:hypothetical protein [Erysipelotrichaceae bacterium]